MSPLHRSGLITVRNRYSSLEYVRGNVHLDLTNAEHSGRPASSFIMDLVSLYRDGLEFQTAKITQWCVKEKNKQPELIDLGLSLNL